MFELILGKCNICHGQLINKYWCKECRTKYFLERFPTWTSGNEELDNFIQESQLNAREEHGYFRWFNHDIFENIRLIGGNKGFSEVYYATIKQDEWTMMSYDRFFVSKHLDAPDSNIPGVVALKRIINSGRMVKEFMYLIKNYFVCMDETISRCFGITRDPSTQDYMLILQYANMRSLNDPTTLKNLSSSLSWTEKKELFNTIVQAIKLLHESNLVHKNLHLGNILLNSTYPGTLLHHITSGPTPTRLINHIYISDIEMCHSINEQKQSSKLYGVVPFTAPEVLKGERQVKSSNIYSLGIILWCIISGDLPYTDSSHDSFLAHEICKGKRPIIPNGTPKDFVDILNQCWESDPSKRPSIHSIAFSLNWSAVSGGESIDYNSNDLYRNPNAFYSKRLIDFNFKSFDKAESYL
ncbi:hypothetical protein RclHR1_06430007 [Rhizophagus clarus]|uniref:Kinase-like domain-containing protein n=1 Tax=Rhizophagus clarus TaxID=94130 RepID=A0A2Z6RS68_9GLOM|nr:hypothetical protein RclHR1_06430007 [Rhizophagus clarus]GES87300.1 kinase-like domain-containing protein [Rhizophagus clarus]